MTGITSDGNIVLVTAPGGLQSPSISVTGSGAGSILLQQGTPQGSAPANSIQIMAPTSVTAYTLTLPTIGPDAAHPLLTFGPDGTGYFTAMPVSSTTTVPTGAASLGSNTFNAPQTVNGGNSSLPLVVTSNNANGASIALDNSSVGGTYELIYSNSSKNTGLWDYTHFRDTFNCSQTDSVTCGATHVVSTSGQPGIAAGVGAGNSGFAGFETSSDNAPSDQSGVIRITTGSAPAANSTVASVTFNQSWQRTTLSQNQAINYAPACTIGPANAAAASLSGSSTVFATVASRSSFSISSNATPLTPSTTYLWTYKCM
jgi:hypothetical protein